MSSYILLSRPKCAWYAKPFQLLIRVAGRSSMTHCAIALDGMVYEARLGGVKPPMHFDDWVKRQTVAKSARIELNIEQAKHKADSMVGMPYDMLTNLSQALNARWMASDGKVNCVEHVAKVLRWGGKPLFHIGTAGGRSPGDIEALAQFDWEPINVN